MILIVFVTVLAVQTIPAQAFSVGGWVRIYEGIEYNTGSATSPRLMKAFALRVSLRNPDVSMCVTHDNGGSPYETTVQGTDAFITNYGCRVATNASFFNAGLSPNTDIWGLIISNSNVVSGPYDIPFNTQLNFTSEKVAELIESGSVPSGKWTSVSGAERILINGACSSQNPDVQPRTFYGLSGDKKYLIMVCVDGRQPGWSEGCNHPEAAQWLVDFGAMDGVLEDGGGSTCLARQDVGVCNRPCYGYVRQVGANFGAFSSLKGTWGPATVSWNSTRTDIFTRGALNKIHQKSWTTTGGWTGWGEYPTFTDTRMTPTVSSWGANRLDLFNVDPAGGVWWSYYNGSAWSSWSQFANTQTFCPLAACSMSSGRIDLFDVSPGNHAIYQKTYSSGAWSAGWTQFPGYTYTNVAPAVCSWGANRIDLFNTSSGGQIYWSRWNGSAWSSWYMFPGSNTPYSPTACTWGANRLDMFNVDPNGGVWWCYYNGTSWSGYTSLGGNSVGPASCTTRGSGLLDVFIRNTNDHLMEKSYNNGTWGGWSDLGPYYD